MVITKDSDSFNPGSSPGRTFLFWWSRMVMLFIVYPGATILPSLWPNWIRRLTTNQKIGGSSPSRDSSAWMPEGSKGADLRSAGRNVRVGSNPTPGIPVVFFFSAATHAVSIPVRDGDFFMPPWPNG